MSPYQVGCCITAHGFGHAARAMAVVESLASLTDVHLTIATMVPEWFFRESYSGNFTSVPVQTDVGIAQKSPLEQDIPATLQALSEFYPLRANTLQNLASIFTPCDIVLCDIAPAGILAAREAGVKSVLIENFTWDWIYEGYCQAFPALQKYIDYLNEVILLADHHIQTEPVCAERECDLKVQPVARPFRMDRGQVRNKLKTREDQRCVLISMGGVRLQQLPLDALRQKSDIVFVVSGYSGKKIVAPNLRYLADHSGLFHPDIVRSCDAVIGKVGYSTLAEVYHADVPLGYVRRKDFRESSSLVAFIEKEMKGLEIEPESFADGTWVDKLSQLFQLQGSGRIRKNGAEECARFLLTLLEKTRKL